MKFLIGGVGALMIYWGWPWGCCPAGLILLVVAVLAIAKKETASWARFITLHCFLVIATVVAYIALLALTEDTSLRFYRITPDQFLHWGGTALVLTTLIGWIWKSRR